MKALTPSVSDVIRVGMMDSHQSISFKDDSVCFKNEEVRDMTIAMVEASKNAKSFKLETHKSKESETGLGIHMEELMLGIEHKTSTTESFKMEVEFYPPSLTDSITRLSEQHTMGLIPPEIYPRCVDAVIAAFQGNITMQDNTGDA